MPKPLTFDPTGNTLPCFADAVGRMRDGSETPREFLERCLERIAAYEPEIRAFVWFDPAGPRAAADAATQRYRQGRPMSPVDGCPVAIKDIIETADMPTQMNSPIFKDWCSGRDAASVHALRENGAVILGKTVTTEFAMAAAGPTRNPFDHGRTPGGSSSGSAAAVAAGMTPVALGTQTAGSIVRPAAYCGVYGFKPSHAALNIGGIHPLSASHDTLGTIAGSLADAWLVARHISAVAGGTPPHPGLQGPQDLPPARAPARLIRLETDAWSETDDATRSAFEAAIGKLAKNGAKILDRRNTPEVEKLETMLKGVAETARIVSTFERRWPFLEYAKRHPGKLSKSAEERVEASRRIDTAQFTGALEKQEAIRRQIAGMTGRADGFVTLTASGPAPIGLEHTGSRGFQVFWTLTAAPCFTLPRLAVSGLPIGLQVLGYRDRDADLAGLARWVDTVTRH
ncbi:MAG: amidase [Alphaproteobacteria bacterium]|nr:amidase [Alphaproteobacteria bacterium]